MNFLKNSGKNIMGDVKIRKILEFLLESFLSSGSNNNVEKKVIGFIFLELPKNLCWTKHHTYF